MCHVPKPPCPFQSRACKTFIIVLHELCVHREELPSVGKGTRYTERFIATCLFILNCLGSISMSTSVSARHMINFRPSWTRNFQSLSNNA